MLILVFLLHFYLQTDSRIDNMSNEIFSYEKEINTLDSMINSRLELICTSIPNHQDSIMKHHRLWLELSNSECELQGQIYFGTASYRIKFNCLIDKYKHRYAELDSLYQFIKEQNKNK